MTILTNGVSSREVPLVFHGATGTMAPHDEHAGRLAAILEGVASVGAAEHVSRVASDGELARVHDPALIAFYRDMERTPSAERPILPDTFPKERRGAPSDLLGRFGYYCTGTQTPFLDTYRYDTVRAAGCALEAAERLLGGDRCVYAAIRPPGHHAGPDYFGGYCYINNTALAGEYLARSGRVAILDVDYHHGNGTQDCFYATDSVLTISIHADTRYAYPCFWGSQEETGAGAGVGCNLNLPVPLDSDAACWFDALDAALNRIADWKPQALVVAFGADTYRADPVGGLSLDIPDYEILGRRVAGLGLPVLALQEGGYALDALGKIVVSFLTGLHGLARAACERRGSGETHRSP